MFHSTTSVTISRGIMALVLFAPTYVFATEGKKEDLSDGKKFGISVLAFTCFTFLWIGFTIGYAKIVDRGLCGHKIEPVPSFDQPHRVAELN